MFEVSLPDEFHDRLHALARARGLTLDALVAEGVQAVLDAEDARRARVRELTERVMAEDARLLARLGDA